MTLPAVPKPPRLAPAETATVSVCIVNWNCRELLRDCLTSLLRHDQGATIEVIVVDNASTDGAADVVETEFPEVVLIRNDENVGFSRANNQAARAAGGRFLFFLNNDTLVPPDTLGELVEEMERRPDIGILAPRLRDGLGRIQGSCRTFPTVAALLHRTWLFRWTGLFRESYRRYRCRRQQGEEPRTVDVVMGAAMLVDRRLFEESGGWDERYLFGGEDIDLCARIGRTRPVVHHPGVEVIHFGRAGSRRRIGHVHTQTLIGITRFLRRHETSRFMMLLYKSAVTIDAPLQWLRHQIQYLWRRAKGQRQAARRSRRVVRAVGHFLRRGLIEFWRV